MSSSFVAPPLPPYQSDPGNMQVWWQLVILRLSAVLDDQQSQIDTIAAMLDDNTLTPDKKSVWVFIYSFLTGEQAGLDSEATTYGITTEKTAYDNAISALTTYLATLTTPVAWNDMSGNTTIVGTTFRSKFNDVLVAKQALLNKMHGTAKSLADSAQTSADAVDLNDKITASSIIPADCLTGSDAGTDATITIADNTRIYGDSDQLAVTGGALTGLAYSTEYGVYYDDPTCSVAAPTYHATTTLSHALNNYVVGRHFVGAVTTPVSGGAATTGGASPPGGGSTSRTFFGTL